MPTLLKGTFKAWIDRMPGPGAKPKLIVVGDVQVPTSGWHVWLESRNPQGVNPQILILDVKAQPPSGIVLEVVTTIPVRFEEQPLQVDAPDRPVRNDLEDFPGPAGGEPLLELSSLAREVVPGRRHRVRGEEEDFDAAGGRVDIGVF